MTDNLRERIHVWAQSFALFVTPIVVAVIGTCATTANARRDSNTRMSELAISVLVLEPTDSLRPLRQWALDVLERHSGIDLTPDLRMFLADSFAFPAQTHADPWDQIGAPLFTPTAPGTYRVTGRGRGKVGLADTVTILVVPAPSPITSISLAPPVAVVKPGAEVSFTVTGVRGDGSMASPIVTFRASGGTISAAGRFTAGQATGEFAVIATLPDGSIADTAQVIIAR